METDEPARFEDPDDEEPPEVGMRDFPPGPINWNLLDAETAAAEWRDLDVFVNWLRRTFGLPPTILPPLWHRHDELIWELSALHTHFLASYEETASASAPITWMRDFAEARERLRDWVSVCGTRLDRDRPTRQTTWPGEPIPTVAAAETTIIDRAADFDDFVQSDVLRRFKIEQLANRQRAS